jgi:hypothetical protein
MALIDTVQARIPASQLLQLTYPDGGGVTPNLTILAEAVKASKGDFLGRVGVALDDTTPNEQHLSLGVRGVMFYLRSYKGLPVDAEKTERDAWHDSLYEFAKIGGGLTWVTPTTDSQLTPSGDTDDGSRLVRPRFDRHAFTDITPNAPGSGQNSNGLDIA